MLNWLYEHKNELNLKMSLAEWPDVARLDLYDVEVSLDYMGKTFLGRGVDRLENTAVTKASSEAIERLVAHELNIESTGLSLKVDSDEAFNADLHAQNEVLERYFLTLHLDRKVSFKIVDVENELVQKFKKYNSQAEVRFFDLNIPNDSCGLGCLIKEGSVTSLGFSVSQTMDKACEKSFVEALPNFYWLKKNEIDDINKPWHLKSFFIQKILNLLTQTVIKETFLMPVIHKKDLRLSEHLLLKSAPIVFSKYEVIK